MNRTKRVLMVCTVLGTLLLNTLSAYAQSTPTNQIYLPLVSSSNNATSNAIAGQYIVVFKDEEMGISSVSAVASEMATSYGGELLQTYDAALNGFAVKFPVETGASAAETLSQDSRVAYVEPDQTINLNEENAVDTTQFGATWGLDRIDQASLPLNSRFTYTSTGAGVNAYIIDTGIRITHSQFGGRASYGYDAVDGRLPADDCHGHGTHVAGTVGGSTYGVAKGVRLIAVRVLGCTGSGSTSGVIAGINWVKQQKLARPNIPAVANMSLGGYAFQALDSAVASAVQAGVVFAVAAGNNNDNACYYSPARAATAITVGATYSNDARAGFSNYGTCVDIFAPGGNITSAWSTGDAATAILSGTSMATPHVVGVIALYLQTHPTATPLAVDAALKARALLNKVTSPGAGSPNRLLFTNY